MIVWQAYQKILNGYLGNDTKPRAALNIAIVFFPISTYKYYLGNWATWKKGFLLIFYSFLIKFLNKVVFGHLDNMKKACAENFILLLIEPFTKVLFGFLGNSNKWEIDKQVMFEWLCNRHIRKNQWPFWAMTLNKELYQTLQYFFIPAL